MEREKTSAIAWWQSIAKKDMTRLERDFENYIVKDSLDFLNGSKAKSWGAELQTYWSIENEKFIGMIELRPHLATPFIREIAGHMGAVLSPSACGRGIGIEVIEKARPLLKKMGLNRFMVTCNVHNYPSQRTIEKAVARFGGAYESTVERDYDGVHWHTMRFWINS
ncbi:MAG: GNAT family N-acetyltransferase [Lactobacillales bacterium]|nr:GNAT family N-acetyltransferase [Lactobacillales bacterium]